MYINDKDKFIILDVEGNAAMGISQNRITQFAALSFHNGEIEELNYYNRSVNYISKYAYKMTHISVKKCKREGLSERHMVKLIYEAIKDCKMIYAYGLHYDKQIINYLFDRYNMPKINIPWYDIINDVDKYLCPSKQKLSIAANEYGFDSTGFHDALCDCYATYHLMNVIESVREDK